MGFFSKVPVVILAGGRGARFDHESQVVPKPLIEVAGKPMLGHIMDLFEAQGFEQFIVLGGYRWELIGEYLEARYPCSAAPREYIRVYGHPGGRVHTHLFDTGEDATTGDRLMAMAADMMPPNEYLGGASLFLLTYGDGLGDVDVNGLVMDHLTTREDRHTDGERGPFVTLTAVNPPGRFGVLELTHAGTRVASFTEKGSDDWINGGFMAVDQGVIPLNVPDNPFDKAYPSFETGALPRLAAAGNLYAHRHTGYWRCMDTRRDLEQIEEDVRRNGGRLPWNCSE